MSNVECRQIEPELSAFLDGELNAERAAAVQRHVAGCAACARQTSALRVVSSTIGELPRASAPVGLSVAVMGEAWRRELLRGGGSGRRRTLYFALRVGASAAMLALVVFASWRLMTPPVYERVPTGVVTPGLGRGAPTSGAAAAKKASDNGPGDALESAFAAGRVHTPPAPAAVPARDAAGPEASAGVADAPTLGTPIVAMKDAGGPNVFAPARRLAGGSIPAPVAESAARDDGDGQAETRGAEVAAHGGAGTAPIEVVVNTVDMVQYSNALRVLAAVSDDDEEPVRPDAVRKDDAERDKSSTLGGGAVVAKQEPAVLRQIVLRGDALRVQSTIDRLEAEAPRQVDVTVNMRWADRDQIGALLNTRAPPDALLAADAVTTAPALAGGSNRPRRESTSMGFNALTPIDQAPQPRGTAGGRGGDNTGRAAGRVSATSQPRSVAPDEPGRETARKEAPKPEPTTPGDAEERFGASADAARGAAPRGARTDSQPRPLAVALMEATGEWLRTLGSQVASAVGIGGVDGVARPNALEPETVMFRVTIVPPPAGATQPSR
ncbi:MAG: zf-HC2 domain-containing protein [Phycisphaerae bacterium]